MAEKGNPVEVIRDRLSNSIGMVSSVQHASYAEALEALAQLEAERERADALFAAINRKAYDLTAGNVSHGTAHIMGYCREWFDLKCPPGNPPRDIARTALAADPKES